MEATNSTEATGKLFIKDARDTFITEIELRDSEFESFTELQLKTKIRDKTGIPVDQQRLIYAGKALDGLTLFECGIGQESTLHLTLRFPGRWPVPEEGAGGMGDKGGTNRIKIMGAAQTDTTEMVVRLFIKMMSGKILTIELCDSEFQSCAALQLKTKIWEKEGVPEDQQGLIYAGGQLKDHRTLPEYGIKNKSTIHVILKLRGGGAPPEEGVGGMGDKGGKNRSMENVFYF